jgi:hypothetical protein
MAGSNLATPSGCSAYYSMGATSATAVIDAFDAGPLNTVSQGSSTVGWGLPLPAAAASGQRFYRGAAQPPYEAATEAVAVLAVESVTRGATAAAAPCGSKT